MGGLGANGAVQERLERGRHEGSSRNHLSLTRVPNQYHNEFDNVGDEIGRGEWGVGGDLDRTYDQP